MNALRLMNVLALLLILLPWRAQAAEADDFVAASRSQQAQLLSQWAAAPQADRLPLLRALTTESLVMDDGKHAFRTRQGGLQPLGAVAAPQGETRPVRLTNRLRNLAAGALASHLILSDNVTERASAARTLQREATPAMAALLQQRLQAETDDTVRGLLEVALARLQLAQPEASARLAAVTLLGHSADPETQALLIPLPMPSMSRMRRCARRPAIACKRSNIVCCSAICWARPLWDCRWDRCCCWPRWGWRSPMACWGD